LLSSLDGSAASPANIRWMLHWSKSMILNKRTWATEVICWIYMHPKVSREVMAFKTKLIKLTASSDQSISHHSFQLNFIKKGETLDDIPRYHTPFVSQYIEYKFWSK
jgi:hypothetical protein